MQREEFESLTGIRPTWSMYRVIEKSYRASEKSNEEFCRAYVLNIGGVAETIQHFADILESTQQQEYESRIAELQEQLDKELEWKYSAEFGTCLDQESYLEMFAGCCHMSDEEARQVLSDEFGFMLESIKIQHEAQEFEINKYGQTRVKRTFRREAFYDNDGCNYIRFDCAGKQWELVNGELLAYDS